MSCSVFFFAGMVDEMVTGPCIAMELRAQNAPTAFREMCGPHDPVSKAAELSFP